MKTVAEKEGLDPDVIRQRTAAGTIAIPCNINHRSISPEGIGQGLRTKINVNLGISGDCPDYSREMEKVKLSIEYGAESLWICPIMERHMIFARRSSMFPRR